MSTCAATASDTTAPNVRPRGRNARVALTVFAKNATTTTKLRNVQNVREWLVPIVFLPVSIVIRNIATGIQGPCVVKTVAEKRFAMTALTSIHVLMRLVIVLDAGENSASSVDSPDAAKPGQMHVHIAWT